MGTPPWPLKISFNQSPTQMSEITRNARMYTITDTVYNILSLGLKFLTSKFDSFSPFENFHLVCTSSFRKWACLQQTISL